MTRKAVAQGVRLSVLTEAGYRCAVPTCRTILAIDIHHIVEVAEGGGNDPSNLVALCPTCHALHHRGTISQDSIRVWKSTLVALSQAFDTHAIDQLLFLHRLRAKELAISGDGVLHFSRLIAAGLAEFTLLIQNGPLVLYEVFLTLRGRNLVEAWRSGRSDAVANALQPNHQEAERSPERTCDVCGKRDTLNRGRVCEASHFICVSCVGGLGSTETRHSCPLCSKPMR